MSRPVKQEPRDASLGNPLPSGRGDVKIRFIGMVAGPVLHHSRSVVQPNGLGYRFASTAPRSSRLPAAVAACR